MKKSHVAGWGSDAPTPAQLKEFFNQIACGRVTKYRMQSFLNLKETPKPYLRHIEAITLATTEGSVTLAEADDVFTGWLDGDFKNWETNVSSEDTVETTVDVHEMVRAGTFKTLLGALGDPRKLCLTQGQIVEFCRSHSSSLRQEGYGTFFLFEVKSNLFIANVDVNDGDELAAGVDFFDSNSGWSADSRYRLVVKQQTV